MDLSILPWIDLKDKDAVYQTVKFLPKAPVIIEAGCAAAEDTLKFKDVWPDSIVYTFEPNPDLFEIATRNISNTKGVHLYPYALADYIGEKTFYMSTAQPAASSFYKDNSLMVDVPQTVSDSLKIPREKCIPNYADKSIVVKCITIDAWISPTMKIDYLWLDTEGAELIILKGAVNTLKNIKVISLEFNFQEFRKDMAQFEEVYNFLLANNFRCHVMWRAHKNWQANGVFIK